MKRLLSAMLLASVAPALVADDACLLKFEYTDGHAITLDVTGLNISAKDNTLYCTNPEREVNINIKDLAALSFTSEPSGVEEIAIQDKVKVYSDAGVDMGEYDTVRDAVKSLTDTGVFIIKSGTKTIKIINK